MTSNMPSSPIATQQQSYVILSLKRKTPSEEPELEERQSESPTAVTDTNDDLSKGEYHTGRVICEVCGIGVSFRDEETSGFTLKHWNEHRITCNTPSHAFRKRDNPSPDDITIRTPSHPPMKRRRAKRTEEERIEYLRDDPYVAKFEAYRVLCASCNKWIRLRPNSTFCSIPWDAHRKSCLSKKTTSNNLHAVEERNTFFSQDTFVRKFDAERVLCNKCDKWISVDGEDHAQAVQTWVQHRDTCHDTARTTTHHPGQAPASSSAAGPLNLSQSASTILPKTPVAPSVDLSPLTHAAASPPLFHDLNPANYAPNHDSRRRNAEQRAATLRADALITEVEPNRVFCSLCQKWVQLRQDSSYCAYPWLQHRGKCLARYQRRTEKGAQRNPGKSIGSVLAENDDPESEEGVESSMEEDPTEKYQEMILHHQSRQPFLRLSPIHYRPALETRGRQIIGRTKYSYPNLSSSSKSYRCAVTIPAPRSSRVIRRDKERDEDEAMDADAEGESYVDDERSPTSATLQGPPASRPLPSGLADLDSPRGRKQFLFASVEYLFRTTYESTDDMPISALVAYLNAAVPPDKFEDFDTCEVVKGVMALQEKGHIKLEGDMLRVV